MQIVHSEDRLGRRRQALQRSPYHQLQLAQGEVVFDPVIARRFADYFSAALATRAVAWTAAGRRRSHPSCSRR